MGYKVKTIDRAIRKARLIPRNELLKPKMAKTEQTRPVFAVEFDPRLSSIQASQAKHWRSMVARDPYLKQVFPSLLSLDLNVSKGSSAKRREQVPKKKT